MRTPRLSVHAVALAVASTTVVAGVLVAGPASAAATSMTFDQPGSYAWTVPQNVTSVHVDALGGSGASGSSGAAGAAANVVADIAVTPGETLYVHVGGNAVGVNGGANGGGSSSAGSYTGGGGGGASDIREGGDSLTDRVLVAAGSGGGSGWGFNGGSAGQPGTDGCGAAAQPGTSSAGGSGGGGGCVGYGGSSGSLGAGGNGGGYTLAASYGGGGGAGYYGGGGGGPYDGGAGGSNLVPTGATNVSTSFGTVGQVPYLQLSYGAAAGPAHSVTVSTADSSLPADGVSTTSATAVIVDQFDNALAGETVAFSSSDPGISFGPVTDNGDGSYAATVTSSTTSGSPTITATDTSHTPVDGSTTLTVRGLAQTVTFSSNTPTSQVLGEQYAPTAEGGGSGQPVTFSVDPATSGYGTDASACSYSTPNFSFNHQGTCVIDADQSGNAQYSAAPTAQQVVAIGQGATATAVEVGRSDVTATVTSAPEGAGTPTGTVTFSVDGSAVRTATLSGSVAHLGHGVPNGKSRHVTAVYHGDADFTGSSASTSRRDPTISARVTSSSTRTRYGWYSAPVTVRFTCTARGASLTASCPRPLTLASSAAGQSVTRTIMATDGGAATATVSGINIDKAAPRAAVAGIRKGSTYRGFAPAARCVGHDALSGVIGCTLTKRISGSVTHYTATVTDRAGNVKRSSSSYHVLRTYLARAPYRSGSFAVHGGRSYTLVATTTGRSAPRYYDAAVKGRTPGPRGPLFKGAGTSHGLHVWTIVVRLPTAMAAHSNWVLGVRSAKTMRIVHIRF